MRASLLALAVAVSGCTADFFVGPEVDASTGANASTSADDDDDAGGPTTDGPDPGTTSTANPGTTEDATSADPTSTTQGDEDGTTRDPESSSSSGGRGGETEEPSDCLRKEVDSCELAFPVCLWDGESCTINECDAAEESQCLEFAPECIWEETSCVPSDCEFEAECSELEVGLCGKTKGCVEVLETCFSLACAPCTEVVDPKLCTELPNCAYNEKREACLPQ